MKLNKTLYHLLIVLSGILLIAFGLYAAGNLYYTDARMYEENWDISLPKNLKQQYHVSSIGALGDGLCYTIYELKDRNTPFLAGASTPENASMQSEVTKILNSDSLKTDKRKYPDFSHSCEWKFLSRNGGNDKLYIIYDSKSSLVYFIQSTQ